MIPPMRSLAENARAVLLPAIADLALTDDLRRFLDTGGCTILIGETREEYVARRMSEARRCVETRAQITTFSAEVRRRAGPALVALDQEIGGIQRLHDLVPQLPRPEATHELSSGEIEAASCEMAASAAALGVGMFLAPVIDVVSGRNPWLAGRTLGTDPVEVGRVAAAYVRGVQAAGMVATAKHFPGHHDITGDPAIEIAEVTGTAQDLEPGLEPFRQVIAAGVRAVMTGPALVPAMDPGTPSSLSGTTIRYVRETLGFRGLIVSDDLDARSTLRNDRDVPAAAVAALAAGSDLLLLSAENPLEGIAQAIIAAVADGRLREDRLAEAAGRVRQLAMTTAAATEGV
jgi:beta-N-acetylhexosaminidase